MFGKQAVCPVKNGLKAVSEVCSANKQFVQLRTGLRLCIPAAAEAHVLQGRDGGGNGDRLLPFFAASV